ncbi:MAG TPA: maltose alpha-D-glucosyltransferase [Polyangiaceae bacterium]|nr:maltose alpha-D-glucosyltransferase [Polyangiaceae bacterium]
MTANGASLDGDPLWYKDAIFYELRVRSLYDSNGDGVGDFPGLTEKLDYFKELGVTTLWLLPFYPSPMKDDGYDTADYLDVHPDCGTLHDFRIFLKEAHRHGLRVVTELVLNHTSDRHPWFQRARTSPPGSQNRDFYVWNDTQARYQEARIIFKDFELSNWTWDPVANAYYWHRFYSHQPDLNFENPAVKRALMRVVDFWFGMGVDGLRLDAVPYLYEREGTSCENLPETYAFLRELRRHVDRKHKNKMLLAEANQWPEDAVNYFDHGKACHMAFHFPIMPRLFMSVRTEDRFPLADIWAQTPSIEETCQWALFLRNHDELTLEMVTDEERDYMYRAYAHEHRMRINLGIRRRLAPLLGNNRRAIELMNALLFSLPGTPVLYYGDEIGMGDNVYLGDRDGVRTPMQWSGDRNAGFSRANPQKLILPVVIDHEYHYQTVNVEAQEQNRHSLLWWMRRLIALRKQFRAFGRGSMEFLNPDNPRVIAFVRSYRDENILVVANLSRFVQYVELDLAKYKGMTPVELFGRTTFPTVGEKPYLLSLGSHVFYWFALEAPRGAGRYTGGPISLPQLGHAGDWASVVAGDGQEMLEAVLPHYLERARWFGGKTKRPKTASIIEVLRLQEDANPCITVVEVEYTDGEAERYVMPMSFVTGAVAADIRERAPERAIAELTLQRKTGQKTGIVCDAMADALFGRLLLDTIERKRRIKGVRGEMGATSSRAFRALRGPDGSPCEPRGLRADQSNSSIVYGDRLILKVFRRLDEGINPDVEIGRFLQDQNFAGTPELAASLDYEAQRGELMTLAVVQGFVQHQGDAAQYTLEELKRFFERVVTKRDWGALPEEKPLAALLSEEEPAPAITKMIGAYLDAARLLGRRTAELHLALSGSSHNPDFAPEPYSALYQRSMYQSMRNVSGRVLRLLKTKLAGLPDHERPYAQAVVTHHDRQEQIFEAFLKRRVAAMRIRCHGHLHLGQFLYTGRDFVVIDLEGDPSRPVSDRRRKRSALRDVAAMIRSFHYAAVMGLTEQLKAGALGERTLADVEPFADLWHTWSSWAYLKGYLEAAGRAPFVSKDREELAILLDAFSLERELLELEYELHAGRELVHVPLHGILKTLGLAGHA